MSRTYTLLLSVLLVLGITATSSWAQEILSKKITVHATDSEVRDVLAEIERQANVRFTYIPSVIGASRKVSIHADDAAVLEVLQQLFGNTITFIPVDKQPEIVLMPADASARIPSQPEQSYDISISGTVVDENGNPLPGANVIERGTTKGTTTDNDGNFSFAVGEGSVLVFSFIGYLTKEVPVIDYTDLIVTLTPDSRTLQEVLVVGYGEQERQAITGAISSINARELVNTPVANVSNALAGRMSGLLVKHTSAEPGEDEPLIRIRGIGTFSGSQDPLIMVDGVRVENFSSIDVNEIESINILKDASATAVYGVRGANGVLLVTTKRGRKGRPTFSFSSNLAFSKFIDMRKYSDSYSWANGYNEALQYDSYVTQSIYKPRWTEEELELFRTGADPIFYPNTNWIDLMMKPVALQYRHNFNVSGGVETFRYFVSLGMLNQGGLFNDEIMHPDHSSQIRFRRYNFRTNLDFDVTSRFSIKVNLSTQIEERRGPAVGEEPGNGTGQIIANMERVPPVMSPGWVDGKVVNVHDFHGGNPLVRLLQGGQNERFDNTLNGIIRFDHKLDFLTPGLSAHATISYRHNDSQLKRRSKELVVYNAKRLPDGSVSLVPQGLGSPYYFSEDVNVNTTSYLEAGFDYARSFGAHNVSMMLLYNQEKTVDPTLEFLVPHGYQGVIGRATYDFRNKYLAEINIGYNGTENFMEDKRFGIFPAYSIGWVISEEPFFPRGGLISFLKLRASLGEVGNDQIGGARFLYRPSSYSYGQFGNYYHFGEYGVNYNRVIGSSEGLIGNPDLTWERARKVNFGAELSLWGDRLTLAFDIFAERRKNILARRNSVPIIFGANRPALDISQQVGYWLPAFNIGQMANDGCEGELTYNNSAGRLEYWIKANYTFARNEVLYRDEVPKLYEYQRREGHRYEQMYGLLADGFYNTWEEVSDASRPVSKWNNDKIQPGDVKYKDINGDGTIDQYDQVPLGYSNFPETIFGLSFGGRLGGIDFTVLLQGATNVSMRYSKRTMQGWENEGGTLQQIIDNSWTYSRYQQGIRSIYPRPSAMLSGHNVQTSSLNIADASYLRLKSVEIGYTIPSAWAARVGLSSVRAFASASNLVTWSDILPGEDPENPPLGDLETYPLTMTWNIGLSIQFN